MSDSKLPFADMLKSMEKFKVPGMDKFKIPSVDMKALADARKADMEAMKEAQTIALAGAKRIAEKQAEIMQTSMREIGDLMKGLQNGKGGDPAAMAGKQQEMAQQAMTKAMGNMRELAETVQKAQTDMLEVLGKRFQANMAEFSKMMKIG